MRPEENPGRIFIHLGILTDCDRIEKEKFDIPYN